jgi:hypothetical protein
MNAARTNFDNALTKENGQANLLRNIMERPPQAAAAG